MITFQSEDISLKFSYVWMNGKRAKIIKVNYLLILRVIYLRRANICTADMGHII